MATTEKYTTVIELNSEQAKRNLDELRRQVEGWKNDLEEAKRQKMGKSFIAAIRKELREAEKELSKYDSEVARTIETMNSLNSASVERIEEAQKSLLRLSKEVPHDSPFYEQLNAQLDQVTQELDNIKATKAFEVLSAGAEGSAKSFEQLKAEADFVKQTVDNIDTASLKQLKLAEQTAKSIREEAQQGSVEYITASSNIEKIRAKLTEVESEEKKVVTLIDRYNQELKGTQNEEKKVVDEMELINRTMSNLQTASIRDIEYSIKALNEQLRETERTGGNVEELTEKLKKLNSELKKVQDMQKPEREKGNIFSRIWTGLNKNWGAITQTLGAYTYTRDVIRGSVEAFAQMDQEMNSVRKYTGQTIEEVKEMNEAFKEMDTRTPREQLNQLAGSAGRLGIQGKDNIMDFVYAADQINLALGDDLGKGAVDQIGKLAMAFGEDDKMGLRDAMLSTGSAVNELAQNSAAKAGYLVDFAARLSGVGVQAGLTQAEILGLGAAMDENMQRDEMAATALSQIITKMTTDSETFARIAGKNVEEFSNLVKTDMNAALMQFFESMNKKGGFAQLAPLFEQMGLDGTRAIGVLSTLASKIDDVRKHQELATKAYREHKSVEAEAEIQNNTYQAKLEKARKAFQDLRIELGEKLLPVASACISTTGFFIKSLDTIIDFIINNYKWILTLTASIAAYNITVHWAAIRTRVLTIATETYTKVVKAARLAVIAFNTAMKSNPWGLVAAGITLAIGALLTFITRTKEAAQAQDDLVDAQKDANRQYVDQEAKIKTLERVMRDEKVALDERRRAIEKLKEIIPGYNAMLTDEGEIIKDNRDAIEDYLKSLKKQILLKVYQDKIVEIIKKQEELREQQEALIAGYHQQNAGAGQTVNTPYYKNLQDYQKYVELGEQIIDLGNKQSEIMRKIADESQLPTGSGGNNDGPAADTLSYWRGVLKQRQKELANLRADANATAAAVEEASKRVKEAEAKVELFTNRKNNIKEEREEDRIRREQERKANDEAKAETERQLAELTHRYAMGKILYCDYIDEQERIQLEGIERRMLIYNTESLEYQKLARKREELLLNGSEESHKLTEAQLRFDHEQRVAMLEKQAFRENMTEQQKNEMLFKEDVRYMDAQRILYLQGTLERINLENEIEERDRQHKLQREQYYQQQLEQAREQLLGMNNQRLMEIELSNINQVYDYMIKKGVAKETEKQEAILAIKAKYAGYQTTSERDQQKGSQMLKVASDAAKQELDNTGGTDTPFLGTVQQYQTTMEKLKQLYGNDKENHAAYLAAKQQATAQFCQDLASQMQAAYNSVNQIMSAASSYFSAQQEYETAKVRNKYEKQIEAAGNNQKKVKKLQEKQAKEEAAIKSKYNKRQMVIQMAQAVAQTAMNAISAYGAALQIGPLGLTLAPIAAAMAIAAGMLQIAALKKQQQAQEAGYYEGGFTGGRRYRKEAGVVHEGEFVANHQAVNNPNIVPFLNFLDQAQRNNTVGSLTMQDVSRSIGTGGSAQIVTPIVNVQTNNEQLNNTLSQVNESIDMLNQQLLDGINATVAIDGPKGLHKQYTNYLKLINRV